MQRATEYRFVISVPKLKDRMVVPMGRRAARQFVFGVDSAGAADDLAQFADIARKSDTRFGRRGQNGKVTQQARPVRLLGAGAKRGQRSDASESGALIGEARDRARFALSDRRAAPGAGAALPLGRDCLIPCAFRLLRRSDACRQTRADAQTAANG
jgi:ATP-dependent Zn protease